MSKINVKWMCFINAIVLGITFLVAGIYLTGDPAHVSTDTKLILCVFLSTTMLNYWWFSDKLEEEGKQI